MKKTAIVGIGSTGCGRFDVTPTELMRNVLAKATIDAGLTPRDIDGLIVCPATIGEPLFMPAHHLASAAGITEQLRVCNTRGDAAAGPVSGVLLADMLIRTKHASVVAVVAADTLKSLPPDVRTERIAKTINHPSNQGVLIVPPLYDKIAQWHMKRYGTKREQLAMVPVLMSLQGYRHPLAMNKTILTIEDVLGSTQIAPVTAMLECARPADGGGAVIVTSSERARDCKDNRPIYILGGGEAAGYPNPPDYIGEDIFPARRAAVSAFTETEITVGEINWWGIYDCFPICFLKFVEEAGLTGIGEGGWWVENRYRNYSPTASHDRFPVNTHGGLLSYGAPWCAPAIFSIIEAVEQIRGTADVRQVSKPSPALIYGNGGIFTSAAVTILSA